MFVFIKTDPQTNIILKRIYN